MKVATPAFVLRLAMIAGAAAIAGAASASAQDMPSSTDQTVVIVVGTTTGGSTDLAARLMAPYLTKYLPGKPNTVVRNQPGAAGLTAYNIFAQQTAPDGKTAIVGSGYQIDPINYRVPQSKYDPTKFGVVGAVGMGGSALVFRNESMQRLTDKTQKPLAMASIPGLPRAGGQMAAWGVEYLGWNVKWVPGYTGNPELRLAIQRGEADMTSLATTQISPDLLDKAKYTILVQSGSNGSTVTSALPGLAGVPLMSEMMKDQLTDPVAKQAFAYWSLNSSIINWLGLPPKTPAAIVETYRSAFSQIVKDEEFLKRAKQIGEDMSTFSAEEMIKIIDTLAELSPEALGHMPKMLARQGIHVPN